MPTQELATLCASYKKVHIDFGTGDGLFCWRMAREYPDMLVIGLDASRESLAKGSARAAKKPARGGAQNALFFCMNVLDALPDGLKTVATSVSHHFPWGSLLEAWAIPEPAALERMAQCAQKNATVDIWLNLQVFEDTARRKTLALPELNDARLKDHLFPQYERAGYHINAWEFLESGAKACVASTWAGRLTRNSKRPTLHMRGYIV